MDIKKLAEECWKDSIVDIYDFYPSNLELFAQKLIAERDAEWMACKVCELEGIDLRGNNQRIPVYAQPEEVK